MTDFTDGQAQPIGGWKKVKHKVELETLTMTEASTITKNEGVINLNIGDEVMFDPRTEHYTKVNPNDFE